MADEVSVFMIFMPFIKLPSFYCLLYTTYSLSYFCTSVYGEERGREKGGGEGRCAGGGKENKNESVHVCMCVCVQGVHLDNASVNISDLKFYIVNLRNMNASPDETGLFFYLSYLLRS